MLRIARVSVAVLAAASLVAALLPAPALAADADADNAADVASVPAYDLSSATVHGLKKSYEYTGKPIEPAIKVEVDGKKVPADAYSVEYAGNVKVGTASVVVTGEGLGSGTAMASFAIVPPATSVKKLTAKGSSLVITWKKQPAQVDGYQVSYSTKKNMAAATTVKVEGRKKTKLTVNGLARGKTYYAKVRTCKGEAHSAWSAAKKLKLAKLTRTDLTGIITKASSKNKGKKSLKLYNTTYSLEATKAGRKLADYIDQMADDYKMNIVMCDLTGGDALTYAPTRSMYSASCLKGPYVASLNKWNPSSKSGSTWAMRETIVWSNNDTYASLRSRYGSWTMYKMHEYAGISADLYNFKYHYLPTRDLAKLWVGTYWYFYQDTNKNSKWARSLYTHGYNSFIYQAMKGTCKVHAKPGWYPGGGRDVQNDAGVVMAKVDGKSRPYVVAIMTSACGEYGKLRKLVKYLDAVHAEMVQQGHSDE